MNPKDIKEWADFITGAFVTWMKAAKRPIATPDLLIQEGGDKKLTTHAIEIWFSSFILSLVIQLPIYKIIGIEWADPAFFAPYTMALFILFFASAAAINFSLKRTGVKAEFPRTFLAYSCVSAVPAPVVTLLTFYGMSEVLSLLGEAKQQGLGFLDSVVVVFPAIGRSVNESIVFVVGNTLTMFLSTIIIGLMVSSLQKTYNASRWEVSRAIGFAVGVLLPIPTVIGAVFIYFVFFAFL